jgi:protocatechuate 3,4-dioxygenase, beta subunit
MPDSPTLSRRKLLLTGLGASAGLVAASGLAADGPAQSCSQTPHQMLGPFFPDRRREDEDLDMTHIAGRDGHAEGELIIVRGQILDENCRPVEGALVEIWQANKWGRYDHELDAGNPRPLDPNFQSWGRYVTGPDGRYSVKTIKPGSYPTGEGDWIRPPHIHFKVSRRGYRELVTQMYFQGEPLNEPDLLRKELSNEELVHITVAFAAAPDAGPGARQGNFNLTLRHV